MNRQNLHHELFANTDSGKVWDEAAAIVRLVSPGYDFIVARSVYDDVMRLFHGEYPGYRAIKTLYHDLPHTLSVFLCAVRLLHGVHIAHTRLSDEEITLVMIAAMMHDIGYAQRTEEGNGLGTGAQYTQSHVTRGINFMHRYFAEHNFPATVAARLEPMIRSTDPGYPYEQIAFPDERCRLLGQLVGTADLVGQMADRTYLEKLLFLYLEFKEANFGNYKDMHDMLRKTRNFYELTRIKLDAELGKLYPKLAFHFKETLGVERNYYLESIEKNIAYLAQVTTHDESDYFPMLKRGGIVAKSRAIQVPA